MSLGHHTVALADHDATAALGAALAPHLTPGMRVYFIGELGAGKTTFTRGLLHSLGHTGSVKSPTYTLVEIYVFSGYILYHFDFYRFNDPQEWLDAGLDEHFNATSICLVEWPEKAGDTLPKADLEVHLEYAAGSTGDSRSARLEALSERGEKCLQGLRKAHPNEKTN